MEKAGKTEMVRFRVPEETAAEYKAAADEAGWTVSLWIRQALKDRVAMDGELAKRGLGGSAPRATPVPQRSHKPDKAVATDVPHDGCACGPALKKMGHAPVCPEHRAR